MDKTIKDLLILALITCLISFLIWLPHLLRLDNFYNLNFSKGMENIYLNFDGLEYVTIAKSFYNPNIITQLGTPKPAYYYASHFPLYPVFILFFAPFLGFLKSMLFVTLLFTILCVWAFYYFVKDFELSDKPLFLSLVFLILPARRVIVHSIGSPEPVFIFFIILSLYFFLKFEKTGRRLFIWACGLMGLLAQLSRPPGILLFLALVIYIHFNFLRQIKSQGFQKPFLNHLKYYPLIIVPLGLLGVFYLFSYTYGDFWAYFHSGDNIHLTFPPFQIFNKHQFWVGDIWLEDVIYIFLVSFYGGFLLYKQRLKPLSFFVLTYLGASIFVVHRDISRYTLPVMPFVIISFEKVLTNKEFKIVLTILALGIYLYAQNFLIENTATYVNLGVLN